MTARNDITGDALVSKTGTDSYRSGWDRIFAKKTAADHSPTTPDEDQAIDECLRSNRYALESQ